MQKKIVDTNTMAQILKLTPRRVKDLANEGLPRVAPGKYDLIPSIWWYIDYLRDQRLGNTEKGVKHKEDLLRLKAEKLDIEQRLLVRELIEIEEVKQALMVVLTALKIECLSLPGRVSSQFQNLTSSQCKDLLDGEIRRILENASNAIQRISEGSIDSLLPIVESTSEKNSDTMGKRE